jgi:hypothetical protein
MCHHANSAERAHVLPGDDDRNIRERGKHESDFSSEETTSHEMPIACVGRPADLLGPLDCDRAHVLHADRRAFDGEGRVYEEEVR